jgi:hypothetical protein
LDQHGTDSLAAAAEAAEAAAATASSENQAEAVMCIHLPIKIKKLCTREEKKLLHTSEEKLVH